MVKRFAAFVSALPARQFGFRLSILLLLTGHGTGEFQGKVILTRFYGLWHNPIMPQVLELKTTLGCHPHDPGSRLAGILIAFVWLKGGMEITCCLFRNFSSSM
jgi:hypothetical protein